MTARTPPRRHWHSDGTEPLRSGAEAMGEPFAAFPSWFLRITCDRCGKVAMLNEAHIACARRLLSAMRSRDRVALNVDRACRHPATQSGRPSQPP